MNPVHATTENCGRKLFGKVRYTVAGTAVETLIVDPVEYTRHLKFPPPAELRIYDTTLRDGEQMPGVAFSPEQKLVIAEHLSAIGCHILDAGFPIVSPGEEKALELLLRARRNTKLRPDIEIVVMSRASEEDITRTIACIRRCGFGPQEVTLLLFTSASGLHCKLKLGRMLLQFAGVPEKELLDVPVRVFQDANCRLVYHAVRYAYASGIKSVEFGAEDASRTPLPELIPLVQSACSAGAVRYLFADTTGCLTPEATKQYCSELGGALPGIQLGSHFHNDFGLVTTNVITAIQYGFSTFSTTVNGIGERAGNAPLHSVVAALRFLYGIEIPGFRYDQLRRLRELVENLSGIPVQCHEPIVGHNAFTHESGIHVHGVGLDRKVYEAIPRESVGGVTRTVYGKHSGLSAILDLLREHQDRLGIPVTKEFALEVLTQVKRVREERAGAMTGESWTQAYYAHINRLGLTEEEVLAIAMHKAAKAAPA